MIKVALLEYEKISKEVAFELSKMFFDTDWTFRHFHKASDLAKKMKEEPYQLFIFNEMFKTARLESVFVHDNPNALFIYICDNPLITRNHDQRARIQYISKDFLIRDLQDLKEWIVSQCIQEETYSLNYDGVHVNLAYEDIYYLEKNGKLVYFHTKKGTFHKRDNMSELEIQFEPYGFIRTHVSFLVNRKYIVGWNKEEVELVNQERIPLSRAHKKKFNTIKKII